MRTRLAAAFSGWLHVIRRWHRRLHLLALVGVLALITILAYQIREKQRLTHAQNLQIQAQTWIALKRQSYGVLAAMLQQDYTTYTGLQQALGEAGNLSAKVYASNISYESRLMDTLARFQTKEIGKNLVGVIYMPQEGEQMDLWFEETPYAKSTIALIHELFPIEKAEVPIPDEHVGPIAPADIDLDQIAIDSETPDVTGTPHHVKKPSVAGSAMNVAPGQQPQPTLSLITVVNRPQLLLSIPLSAQSKIVCVLDTKNEFDHLYGIHVRDERGAVYGGSVPTGQFTEKAELYGLALTFVAPPLSFGFFIFIIPIALIILILLSLQFQMAVYESQHHELTGLPNLRTFEKRLHAALEQQGVTFLLFLDLRNLKLLNTIFMEEQADEVIRVFAKTLRTTLDRGDHVIHRSGDEFLVILNVARHEVIRQILDRLSQVFALKTIRLQVRQDRDRLGHVLELYDKPIRAGEYVDLPIGFRMGGIAMDYEACKLPRKDLLDHVNLLAEQAKAKEGDTAGVTWLIQYWENGREIFLETPSDVADSPQDPPKPRLVVTPKNQALG